MTDETVYSALRDCFDPEIPLNIVELGLVDAVLLAPDPGAPGSGIPGVPDRFSVTVSLLRSDRDEALEAQLAAVVRNRLAGFYEFSRIAVQFEDSPAWTPSRISPQGRRTLGLDRAAFPILNNRVR
jgi:metal-sulfur cluster biosynthetic enzyme